MKAIQLSSILVVLTLSFFGCGSSSTGTDAGSGGGTGGGSGGGGGSATGTTFSGGVTGTTVEAQVSAQSLTSGGSTNSSITLTLTGQDISSGTVSFSSQTTVAAALTTTTYNSTNFQINDSNVRLGSKEWDESLSSNTANNKGSLTVTITSLGTADDGGGGLTNYRHPKGSYVLVAKSTASDADVTVTGNFGD